MKKILMICLTITMVVAGSAMAQQDSFGIFMDQAGLVCENTPSAPSPIQLFVVHKTGTAAAGSQFKLVNSSGWSLSASTIAPFLTIGDAFSDVSLAYAGCVNGPAIAVILLSGFAFPVPGTPCGVVEVVAAPGKSAPLTVDCNFAELPATGGRFVFNGDTSCPCNIIATEESTWGKVKNLYR
jgi:hypothetical protein